MYNSRDIIARVVVLVLQSLVSITVLIDVVFLDLDVQDRGLGSRYGHSFRFTEACLAGQAGDDEQIAAKRARSSLMMLRCSESQINTASMTASTRFSVVKTSAPSRGSSVSPLFSLPYPAYAFITTFLDDRICSVSSNFTTIVF
jgi:hypothetical protein